MQNMKNNLVYICSPYRGNILEKARNILYARHLTKLALQLGYTPITTHLYLTQVLNDNIPMQRRQGLKAGRDILNACDTIIIGARHTIKTTTDVQQTAAQSAAEETKTYTQAEIEKMSRENIIALGTKLGYTMTTTASDEKSAVVADFMAQQTAAQNK